MQKFSLAQIMSAYSGYLLVDDMDLLYEIMDYMTQSSNTTIGLLNANTEVAPYLLEQFPFLSSLDYSSINRNTWKTFLKNAEEKYGVELDVRHMHLEDHEDKSDFQILDEMGFKGKVIEIKVDNEPNSYGDINWK